MNTPLPFACLLLTTLALSACGGGGSDDAAAPRPAPSAPATLPAVPQPALQRPPTASPAMRHASARHRLLATHAMPCARPRSPACNTTHPSPLSQKEGSSQQTGLWGSLASSRRCIQQQNTTALGIPV